MNTNIIELEKAVVNTVVNNQRLIHKVRDLRLMNEWQNSNARTIYNKLINNKPILEEELQVLGTQTISNSSVESAVEELLESDYRRSINLWLQETIDAQTRGDLALADRLLNNKPSRVNVSRYSHVSEGLDELMELAEMASQPESRIVKNPFSEYAAVIGDLGPGSLHVIGGPPGSLKSGFIEQFDIYAARKFKGAVYSLEMTRPIKLARYAQHLFGPSVGPKAIQTGSYDAVVLARAREELKKLKLFIDDKPTNIIELIDSMELIQQDQDPDYYSIDFLQLLNPLNGENDYQAVKNNMKQIYHFAKRHNKPVFVLSQLNRESRKDLYGWKGEKIEKTPNMADLEGAGTIEQVAHSVTIIQPVEEDNSVRRVYIAKNRNGESPYDFTHVPVIPSEMNFKWSIDSFYD